MTQSIRCVYPSVEVFLPFNNFTEFTDAVTFVQNIFYTHVPICTSTIYLPFVKTILVKKRTNHHRNPFVSIQYACHIHKFRTFTFPISYRSYMSTVLSWKSNEHVIKLQPIFTHCHIAEIDFPKWNIVSYLMSISLHEKYKFIFLNMNTVNRHTCIRDTFQKRIKLMAENFCVGW